MEPVTSQVAGLPNAVERNDDSAATELFVVRRCVYRLDIDGMRHAIAGRQTSTAGRGHQKGPAGGQEGVAGGQLIATACLLRRAGALSTGR